MFLTRAVHQFIHHKSRLILSVRSGIALHPPCFQWCWMSGAEVCVCVSVCVFGCLDNAGQISWHSQRGAMLSYANRHHLVSLPCLAI